MAEQEQAQTLEAALGAEPAVIFQGYDTFSGGARQKGLTGTTATGTEETDSYYKVCYNHSDLKEALKISGSVTASFTRGSMSAKAEFVRNLKITNTCITIVLYKAIKKMDTYTDVSFAKSVNNLPPKELCLQYGDSFVNSIVTGAEYFATYVLYTESATEQESLKAELEGKYKLVAGRISAELQAQLTNVRNNVSKRQTLSQKLIGFSGDPPLDENKIVEFATQLTRDKIATWGGIGYETLGYEHVAGAPDLTKVIGNREKLKGLNNDLARLNGLKNQVDWLKRVYNLYGYASDTNLDNRATQIDADIKAVDGLLDNMSSDPTQSYKNPELKSLDYGLPQLQCDIKTIPAGEPWGGNGGGPFDHFQESDLHLLTRLTKVSMRGSSIVDRLTATYRSISGENTYDQGGGGGNPSGTLNLQDGERIVEVQVKTGTYSQYVVSSLKFKTNKENSLDWPPSPNTEKTCNWKAGQGEIVLGFAGRNGLYLDQFALKVGTFNPAKWVK